VPDGAEVLGTGSIPTAASDRERTIGILSTLGAYLLWGLFPIYFIALEPTGPWEVVGWRIVLSFVFCLILLTIMRAWPKLWAINPDLRQLADVPRRHPHRPCDRGEPRLLHQPDRHRAAGRAGAA
jgi:chloramphenicol-sensitive protein RarD